MRLISSLLILLFTILTACHSHYSIQKNNNHYLLIQTGKPMNISLSSSELLYKILEFASQINTRQSFQQENVEKIIGIPFSNIEHNTTDKFFTVGNTTDNHIPWKIWVATHPDTENLINYLTIQFYQKGKDISDFTATCPQLDVKILHQKLEQLGITYQMKQHLGKWVNFYKKDHDNGYTVGVSVYYINTDTISNNKQCIEKIIISFYKI